MRWHSKQTPLGTAQRAGHSEKERCRPHATSASLAPNSGRQAHAAQHAALTPKIMEMAPVMMAVRWPLAIEGSSTTGRGCGLPPLPPLPPLPAAGGAASAAPCCCCWPSPSAARHSRARRVGVVVGSQARRARGAATRTGATATAAGEGAEAVRTAAGTKARRVASALVAMAARGRTAGRRLGMCAEQCAQLLGCAHCFARPPQASEGP